MDKKRVCKEDQELDAIRGSLIGGAVGDALGYAIEFQTEEQIFGAYGANGITEYELIQGKALISDDTQMTLFTADGLLVGDTRGRLRGVQGRPHDYVKRAYADWYLTQTCSFQEAKEREQFFGNERSSWLLDIPELFACRAPGNTCLSALAGSKKAQMIISHIQSTIARAVEESCV